LITKKIKYKTETYFNITSQTTRSIPNEFKKKIYLNKSKSNNSKGYNFVQFNFAKINIGLHQKTKRSRHRYFFEEADRDMYGSEI